MFDVDEFDAELLRAGRQTLADRRPDHCSLRHPPEADTCCLCEDGKSRAAMGRDNWGDWSEVLCAILGVSDATEEAGETSHLEDLAYSKEAVGIGQQLAAEFMGLA